MVHEQCDEEELNSLIVRNIREVYRLSYIYFKDDIDAEDIVKQVFWQYANRRPTFQEMEEEKFWFTKINIKLCKELSNVMWLLKRLTGDYINIEKKQIPESLDNFLEWSRSHRIVFYLHIFHKLSSKQISELLKKKEKTISLWLKQIEEEYNFDGMKLTDYFENLAIPSTLEEEIKNMLYQRMIINIECGCY